MKALLQHLYNITLRNRRLNKFTEILTPYMPENAVILDLGCGNGDLAAHLQKNKKGLQFVGLEIKPREDAAIPIMAYDGTMIPYEDNHFDYVMLVTVLHHTDDYLPLLKEAKRVAKKGIIIADHQYKNKLEWLTLAFIDWPGNVPFGVYTPFNFKTRSDWQELYRQTGLVETAYNDQLYVYGKTADFALGKKMHFISVLDKEKI